VRTTHLGVAFQLSLYESHWYTNVFTSPDAIGRVNIEKVISINDESLAEGQELKYSVDAQVAYYCRADAAGEKYLELVFPGGQRAEARGGSFWDRRGCSTIDIAAHYVIGATPLWSSDADPSTFRRGLWSQPRGVHVALLRHDLSVIASIECCCASRL
jgi:hypothetical protein